MPIRLRLSERNDGGSRPVRREPPWFFVLAAALPRLAVEVFRTRWGKGLAVGLASMTTLAFAAVFFVYLGVTDRVAVDSLGWREPALLYAEARTVFPGQRAGFEDIESYLRQAGLSEDRDNPVGYFSRVGDSIEVHPGDRFRPGFQPATIQIANGRVEKIARLYDYVSLPLYRLAPALVTPFFGRDRMKVRALQYDDIPVQLRDAILAVEDHRFFEHYGIDVVRTIKAAHDGLASWHTPRGTSTLTQQLARELYLTKDRTYERKIKETAIALKLETLLSKRRIFAYYCNRVAMGSVAGFHILGFAEAAEAYLGKDVSELTLAEAALLAGMPQQPSSLNPLRYPERARRRRDVVLRKMLHYGQITSARYNAAIAEPIPTASRSLDVREAPYFVDLVRHELEQNFDTDKLESRGYRVQTTIDLRLQGEAVKAVRDGLDAVDKRIARQRRFRGKKAPRAQAALVAISPATGEVKALVGGRNYAESQLNRVLAERQPGSAFKPFVYAAAIDTGRTGDYLPLTAASTVLDETTVFETADNQEYQPSNFSHETHGMVTFRDALRESINIATVRVAERVGYGRVAQLARRAGMGDRIQPTPSLALGAYEVTPLELAEAYTVFADGGLRTKLSLIRSVEDAGGRTIYRNRPQRTAVLDPRVAYIVTNMMEDVINRGTGAGVRAMGFREPAAGKTGTDNDGWFVGFTSNLLCVVWVGFDDNTDLGIEGAKSALPIWTEFMKQAHQMYPYRHPRPFEPACGVTEALIDADTGLLAGPGCERTIKEVFIAGTEPHEVCPEHRPSLWSRTLRIFHRPSTPPAEKIPAEKIRVAPLGQLLEPAADQ